MRVSSVEITGFGGVPGTTRFDLDSDVVVIWGPNGYGKTTICDAIGWALHGSDATSPNPRNLYSRSGSTAVSLSIRDGDRITTVTRTLRPGENPVDASVTVEDPTRVRRGASALEWIGDLFGLDTADDIGLAIRDSVASMYMRQESLRDFLVAMSDSERFTVIARMVGAARLGNFVSVFESEKTAWNRALNKAQADFQPERDRLAELELSLFETQASLAERPSYSWDEWLAGFNVLNPDIQLPPHFDPRAARNGLAEARREATSLIGSLDALTSELAVPIPRTLAQKEFAELQRRSASLIAVRDDIARQATSLRQTLAELEQRAEQDRSDREELAAMADLAEHHLGDNCPLCGQAVVLDEFVDRLRSLKSGPGSSNVDEKIAAVRREISEKNVQISKLGAQIADEDSALTAARSDEARARALREVRAVRAATLGLPYDPEGIGSEGEHALQSAIYERRAEQERRLEGLSGLELGLRLAGDETASSSRSRAQLLEVELDAARNSAFEIERDLEERRRTSDQAEAVVKALKAYSETYVADRIRDLQPLLDQFYAAIDPHPTFTAVDISTTIFRGKQRLSPRVRDDTDEVTVEDPGRTMSTSQANALAVALFLAFNLGFSESGLRTLVLDDPLQNLDDVHLLGMVDLLRKLAPHRQIFVTTHDQAFAELLGRKLRPVGGRHRTTVVEFTEWSKHGPKYGISEVPADPAPLKLAQAT
nr:AAA family ATPase [Leifsonia sp. Leaf325]